MSQLSLFASRPVTRKGGRVERFGAYLGPGDSAGFALLLEGEPQAFIVLRDTELNNVPYGLTQPGDDVEFSVDAHGRVKLSSFTNCTLAHRLGLNDHEEPR